MAVEETNIPIIARGLRIGSGLKSNGPKWPPYLRLCEIADRMTACLITIEEPLYLIMGRVVDLFQWR